MRGRQQGKLKVGYERPMVYDYQRRFMDGPERFTVIEAATKIGKTASMIIWLFEQALQGKAGQNFWWVAPSITQAKIAFDRMKIQVKVSLGETASKQGFFKVNLTDRTLTLPNKAIITFKTAENPDLLYGEDVYAAVFDEFTRARQASWIALRSTLTSTRGKCKFIGNVRGRGWGYQLAQKAKNDQNPKYKYYKITAWDAVMTGRLEAAEVIAAKSVLVEHKVFDRLYKYAVSDKSLKPTVPNRLPLEEILEAEDSIPDHIFKELFECVPSDDGGNPFGIKNIERATIDGRSKHPAIAYGIDLASIKDFTVITGLDGEMTVSKFDRFRIDWPRTTETLKRIPDLKVKIDATGVGLPVTQELQKGRKHMEAFVFSSTSKQILIEALATAFQRNELKIPKEYDTLLDELYSFEYTYTRAGGIKYAAPDDMHDDCVMSLALAYSAFKSRPAPSAKPKATSVKSRSSFRA